MAFVRTVTPTVIGAASGFFMGGPVGAAIGGGVPAARNFIASKIARLVAPRAEEVPPHVQYLIGDQAAQIQNLEVEIAKLKTQLDALKVPALTAEK